MRFLSLSFLGAGLAMVSPASAVVLLSTDFTGRTISGKTANDITWVSNGLSAPTSLTAVDEAPTNASFGSLFDTANTQGHFAPDKNIDNEGPWSTTTMLTVTGSPVLLESIDIDWQHFSNGGAFQGPARTIKWTVTVTGSSSGLLAGGTVVGTDNAPSGLANLAFTSPLTLTDSETYDVKFFVTNDGNALGNNTGFDGLSFNGQAVPEPSSTLLLALGAIGLMARRRSKSS